MNTFTVNGKEYEAKPFDFNLVCDMEDMGIQLEEMGKKTMSMIRAYFAICAGKGSDFAGKELNSHYVGGGKFDSIFEALDKEIEISDFFQALIKGATEETTADETAQKAETGQN